ncbi:hypothetical protein G6Z07_08130 [Clostridium perfringens]|uniref:hypothetical protein n=1 Tax=Clostridium perfringens TaxID=1502 RepID=UPI0013E2C410|nr:hypothetical protein [Clostridium perfringens]NGT72997.1 hypothetical protein [Clostridium perfringens]
MKKWKNPKLMILGVENTNEGDAVTFAPPWQDCDCYKSGNSHIHGAPGQVDCPCCGSKKS